MKEYPHLERIVNLYPGPQALLGKTVYWTEKRDGAQLRVAHGPNGLLVGSHYKDAAAPQIQDYLASVPCYDELKELVLQTEAIEGISGFGDVTVFGELLVKGKSPARFETHERHEFVIFDIYQERSQTFMPYPLLYQTCNHYSLPVVACWAETRSTSLESLYAQRERWVDYAKTVGREGTVLKAYTDPPLFCKEKVDLPTMVRVIEEGSPVLPPLPESEVYGAIAKAHAELGELLGDKTQAMPLIARLVAEEQRKHQCGKPPGSLFTYYQLYLQERSMG